MNSLNEEFSAMAQGYGLALPPDALEKAAAYIERVRASKANVTAEEDEEGLWLRHLADGLPAAAFLKKLLGGGAPRIADLGAGGGFIGFCVKLAWAEAEVTLIESVQRKYDFLNVAAVKSGMKGLRVVKARAGMADLKGGYDAVVERALAPLPQAVGLACPLLKPGGFFVAYQSDPPDLKEPELGKSLSRVGARFVDMMTYRLPREERDRRLIAFRRED